MSNAFDSIVQRATARMAETHVPGLAVATLHHGQVEAAGLGVTSVANPLAVTPDTLFQIGSITKTFIGTTAMRLVELGALDLDAPVKHYLPELRLRDAAAEATVTMRHLLSHTGGWAGDYFNDFGWGDDALARMVAACADLPQLTPAGSLWHYNNAGFAMAGLVIQRVTGRQIEDVVRDLVFAPLGLNDSTFWPQEAMVKRFAVGHLVGFGPADVPAVATPWPIGRASHPAGAITSTVMDLMRYSRQHLLALSEGQRPALTPESVLRMREPVTVAGGASDAWSLSLSIRYLGGRAIVGHGGATNGFIAEWALLPDEGFAIAVLTNANRGRELTGELVNLALKERFGLEKPPAAHIALSPGQLAGYVGRYDAQLQALDLSVDGAGRLALQVTPHGRFPFPDSPPPPAPPPTWLAFQTPDRAEIMDGPMKGTLIEVLRDAAGGIAWLRMGSRLHRPC
ncbi:MAG: beta-lactamase family protein [Thermoflexales bacterium]|nr:beta-lactamase family protein [Thermoflexales bacterium]